MRAYRALALFIVVVLGGGTAIGLATLPGEWYAGLAKPAFNPPSWVFAPVWSTLYVLIAVAGWRSWMRAPYGPPMLAWVVQLVLNFLWSPIFFGGHMIGAAFVVILALLASILAFSKLSWPRDRVAAWLFVPYALLVAFASLLNGALWWLN